MSNIKVGIKVRPLIQSEKDRNRSPVWTVKDENCLESASTPAEKFYFDRVFAPNEGNEAVYQDMCFPIVKSVMEGFNGTIFAYGQTSSGKTYTMMGEHSGIVQGVIHCTISDIFEMIQDMPDREFLLRMSFIEIYNEKVYDLLSEKNEELKILKDRFGSLKVSGVEEKIVQTPEQIFHWMNIGIRKRRTAETQMNRASSRSHSILMMVIESRLKSAEDPAVNVAHLNLVDLAGSENIKETKTKGDRFKEGTFINLSLSTLSLVISQLSDKENQFIPYRNSKLTRLLQNSLGGNALTAIICTVNPVSSEQTRSTLNFATRAKKIKNKPEKNEILTDQAVLKQYANKIKKLTEQLEASKQQGKELEEKTKQNESLKCQIEALKSNFVTYIVPEKKNQIVRRETWGGRSDARRLELILRGQNETAAGNCLDLATVEEEAEGDDDSTFGRSCVWSPKYAVRRSGASKKNSDAATQTPCEDHNVLLKAYDDAMALVSELKSSLTKLQEEKAQLTEFTTLEKQCLRAADEQFAELNTLRKENKGLKEQLTVLEHQQPTDSIIKENKRDTDSQLTDSIVTKLNNAVCLGSQTSLSLSDSSRLSLEKSSLMESTLMDETGKSHFLALHDEFLQSETQPLRAEIETLKRDCEWKDSLISNLRQKIEEMQQSELEINIGISGRESNIGLLCDPEVRQNCCESLNKFQQKYEEVLEQNDRKDQQIKVLNGKIKELLDRKDQSEDSPVDISILKSDVESLKADNDLKSKQIQLLKDKLEIKDQMISSLKDEMTLNQTYILGKTDSSMQTSYIEKHSIGTDFSGEGCSPPKRMRLSFGCQTSPVGSQHNRLNSETTIVVDKTSDSDSDDGDGRISPLGLYLLDSGIGHSSPLKKCTPMKIRDLNSQPHSTFHKDHKFVQTSPSLSHCNGISQCNCEAESSTTLETQLPAQNESDELKLMLKKLQSLRAGTYETLEKFLGASTIDGEVAHVATGSPSTVEQEINALRELIIRLEFYIRDIKDDSELLNQHLESKFEEVISLQMKAAESESNLSQRELELSNVASKISKLKEKLSELSFVSRMAKNMESVEELKKLKESSNGATSMFQRTVNRDSSPLHNLIILENTLSNVDSHMQENALLIIDMKQSLKKAQNELAALKERPYCPSKKTQTDQDSQDSLISEPDVGVKKSELVSQLERELTELQEKNFELTRSNRELKNELRELQFEHAEALKVQRVEHDMARSKWELRTRELVQEVESKFEQELKEQEEKLEAQKRQHLEELKRSISEKRSENSKDQELLVARAKASSLAEKLAHWQEKERELRRQLEDKGKELLEVKRKCTEQVCLWKRKCLSIKDTAFNYELKIVQLNEEVKSLEARVEEDRAEAKRAGETIRELIQDKDTYQKKYLMAKQRIVELSKNGSQAVDAAQPKEFKELELEEYRRLVNELDQRKAKIMTLEENNAGLVREVKKLQEAMSAKKKLAASTNQKAFSSYSVDNLFTAKVKADSGSSSIGNENIRKGCSQGASNCSDPDTKSNGEVDQEGILRMGGSSGAANLLTCYYLEGKVHKKNKELHELQKKLDSAETEVKALKQAIANHSEQKKPSVKKNTLTSIQGVDDDVTVTNAASHPYPPGAIPEVQPKHVLRERNRTSNKTDNVSKAEKESAAEEINFAAASAQIGDRELTDAEAAQLLLHPSECTQQ